MRACKRFVIFEGTVPLSVSGDVMLVTMSGPDGVLNCEWALCFVKTLHHALLHLPLGSELQEVRRGGLAAGAKELASITNASKGNFMASCSLGSN